MPISLGARTPLSRLQLSTFTVPDLLAVPFYSRYYSILGLHEVDLDDMTSARQLLLKRSVMSDVKEKLIEATKNQWEDWLEFSLFQAEQLGLDYHEDQEVMNQYEFGVFSCCTNLTL